MKSIFGLAAIPAIISKVRAYESVCSGTTEFVKLSERQTFVENRESCQLLGEGFDIASITNLNEDNAVRSMINLGEGPFIGLLADNPNIGGNASEFVFVDGRTDGQDYYDVNKGEQPWLIGEPNNVGTGENCVHMNSAGWNDIGCEHVREGAICRRDNSPRCDLLFQGPSTCHDGSILALISEPHSFDEARAVCKSFSPDSDVVIIEDVATNEAVKSMIKPLSSAYIGIRAFGSLTEGGNSSDFDYVDDQDKDRDFFVVPSGQFPWIATEPNNIGSVEERCVEIRVRGWNDISCDAKRPIICQVPNAAECANVETEITPN